MSPTQEKERYGYSTTCKCDNADYKPNHYYTYSQDRVFFCENCKHPLSMRQMDEYDESERYLINEQRIKVQREARGYSSDKDPFLAR
jgi:hypothetical protein